jgi:hypothetical protein
VLNIKQTALQLWQKVKNQPNDHHQQGLVLTGITTDQWLHSLQARVDNGAVLHVVAGYYSPSFS